MWTDENGFNRFRVSEPEHGRVMAVQSGMSTGIIGLYDSPSSNQLDDGSVPVVLTVMVCLRDRVRESYWQNECAYGAEVTWKTSNGRFWAESWHADDCQPPASAGDLVPLHQVPFYVDDPHRDDIPF
jgi:hypothetical protein